MPGRGLRPFAAATLGWLGLLGMPPSIAYADQQADAKRDTTFVLPVIEAEAVIVTGTAIRKTPIDLPVSITVLDRDELTERGAPSMVDLFKNLSVSSGVIGEVSSWYNAVSPGIPETVANVNLRGLGASRTLVLLNGRRQTYVPGRLIGGRFVDVNAFPSIAIRRMEILKEGAGAIYGSDAIGGVANFITRSEFEGFEGSVSYEHYSGSNDMQLGGIWGGALGPARLVVSLEHKRRTALDPEEREWTLRRYPDWGWGWSGTGNPGAFVVPDGFVTDQEALAAAPRFLDPRCAEMGGYPDTGSRTCRFRYQPWDNLIERSFHTRGFAELNGELGNARYHVEALYADARIPDWITTPSFPPISSYDGMQIVFADHPGRQEFVANNPIISSTAGDVLELTGDQPWYFFGRLVGNRGPGRTVPRESRTRRLAGSLAGTLGRSSIDYDLGISYSDAKGTVRRPAEYAYRKFLAFRGFGGVNCGVEAVAEPNAPSGLRLGRIPGGVVRGEGDCAYYNPFSNGIRFSAQPGAAYTSSPNPDFRSPLEVRQDLIDWINEEVAVTSNASLFVVDATLNGVLKQDAASYAVGYQMRFMDVDAAANDPGNLAINPCRIPGDTSCAVKTGSFTFTSGIHPYADSQTNHTVFGEVALRYGGWLDSQAAVHFEDYGFANSIDPKLSLRAMINDVVSLRGTVQTSFRTPSVDDLNEDVVITTDYVAASGTWKAIENRGTADLVPEEAFTYNLGLVVKRDTRFDFTLDYWNFDFDSPIGVMPYAALADAYADLGTRGAVQDRIFCPGNVNDGSCDPVDIERIRINHINWSGLTTSGIDWHIGGRQPLGGGAFSVHVDGSYRLTYDVETLEYNGVVLRPGEEAAGYLNRTNPLAPPLPRWRANGSVSYHWDDYGAIVAGHYISSYKDRDAAAAYAVIDPFFTVDANFQWSIPNTGAIATLSLLNLADATPPLVHQEMAFDALTHNPKGRRIKLGMMYQFR